MRPAGATGGKRHQTHLLRDILDSQVPDISWPEVDEACLHISVGKVHVGYAATPKIPD